MQKCKNECSKSLSISEKRGEVFWEMGVGQEM